MVDFGTVLASGQTLKHEFEVPNPTGQAIRVLRATALTPCCSSIQVTPKVIPRQSQGMAAIAFKPGHEGGPKRVEFLVETDSSIQPLLRLAATATIVPAWEIQWVEGSERVLPVSTTGSQRFRLVARKIRDQGRELPVACESSATSMSTRLLGEVTRTPLPGGGSEEARELLVTLPSSREPGFRREEIRLRWKDGVTEALPITWRVEPRLVATPAGLILQTGSATSEVRIRIQARDRPFRVTGIRSELSARLPEPGPDRRLRHDLRLLLDASRVPPSRRAAIEILTDHPDQPITRVSVLVLSAPG